MKMFWRLLAASCLLGALAPVAPVLAAELELLSFAPAEPHALGATTTQPLAMSADGRFVLLSTLAPNLIAGVVDRNGCNDLIVVDRQTGERRLLSHEPGQPNVARPQGGSAAANSPGLLSADGRVGLFRNASDRWCSFGEAWFLSDLTDGSVVALADLVTVPGLPGSPLPKALSADGRRLLVQLGDHVVLHDRTSGSTVLISHAAGDPATVANGRSEPIALTPDGRFVLFSSAATDLIAGFVDASGTNGDLYLFDTATATTTLVSRVAGTTTTGGGAVTAGKAFVTPDGATVVFNSVARNLVPGQIDTQNAADVFRFEVATGTMNLVSHPPGEPLRSSGGSVAGLSADGRYTVFGASTLAATGGTDGNGSLADVFLHDRQSDASVLVSQAAGAPNHGANQESGTHTLSTDGRYVLFASNATNLIPGPPPSSSLSNLFRFDRTTGAVELVNHVPGQLVPAVGGFFGPVVTDAGVSFVAIANGWPDLAAPWVDGNNLWDTFVFDLAADVVETLSIAAFPVRMAANLESDRPIVSANGKVVGYNSESLEMLPGFGFVTNPGVAVVFDGTTGQTELVSHAAGRPDFWRNGSVAGLSADGRWVLLASPGNDLVAGQIDSAFSSDVFLYDRTTRVSLLVSAADENPLAATTGAPSALSLDGRFVLWSGPATGVVSGTTPSTEPQLYLFDRSSGKNRLVSHVAGAPFETAQPAASGFGETLGWLSEDGRRVLFSSLAPNLVPGDTNLEIDIFLFDAADDSVRLVSHPPGSPGVVLPGESSQPLLDAAGRFAAFVHRPSSSSTEIHLWDSVSGDTTRIFAVSHPPGAVDAGLRDLSTDGRYLLFDTRAQGFVPGVTDAEGSSDSFVYDRVTASFRLASFLPGQPTVAAQAKAVAIGFAGSGRVLFRALGAAFLPPGATSTANELVLLDLVSGRRELLTHRSGEPLAGVGIAWYEEIPVSISAAGDVITFSTKARGLVVHDYDWGWPTHPLGDYGGGDVFLYRPDGLFSDGFESGDLSAWSAVQP